MMHFKPFALQSRAMQPQQNIADFTA